jgi:2-polyprenyl-3-methyl-5-hydroxy-6-metoxy-1,4-benzoquinol methylase
VSPVAKTMQPDGTPRGLDVNLRAGPQQLEYSAIAERIVRDRPGRMLDWGCGWGHMTDRLRRRGLEVDAFDFRPEIEREGLHPLERFPHIEAYLSAEPVKLPYDDAAFDAALSLGVLEHVMDPGGSLVELRRVLKPGGTLYVFKLPNRFSYLEAIAKRAGLYYHGQLPFDRLYDMRRARELIARSGFDVIEIRRMNMLPLTVAARWLQPASQAIWRANGALSRVRGLNVLATNVELVARAS